MRSGALFAGYGGVELAVHDVLDVEPAWFAEFDQAPSKVLAEHWPDVPNYGDVTKIKWTPDCPTCGERTGVYRRDGKVGPADDAFYWCATCSREWDLSIRFADPEAHLIPAPVDIITGGFPCQDVSHAGKRAGLKDGTRSGLWARMCDAIAALRPRLVLAENVRGLLSAEGEEPTDAILRLEDRRDHLARSLRLVEFRLTRDLREGKTTHVAYYRRDSVRLARLHKRAVGAVRRERAGLVRAIATVLRDLADIGYDAAWVGLRAADVGAPHGRFRVFILAWPAHTDGTRREVDRTIAGAAEVARTGRRDTSAGLSLLPTPAGMNASSDPGSVESWMARRDRMLKLGINGNGIGMPLGIAVRMLPTPRATDGTKGGPNQRGSSGDLMLPSAVQLMPTPSAADAMGGHERRGGARGDELLLNGVAKELARENTLLPTPRATRGASGTETMYALGAERSDDNRPQGQVLLPTPTAMDSEASGGAVGSSDVTLTDATVRTDARGIDFGAYAGAIARWEPIVGRPAPCPTEPTGKAGAQRLSPRFVEWMMGLPDGHVTGVDITRNEQLKALGNGVVPQQAAAALGWLLAVHADATTRAAA